MTISVTVMVLIESERGSDGQVKGGSSKCKTLFH